MNRLYLSQRGKKTVVTEWLKDDIAITEYLAAGAIIHSDGRMTWQQ
jgi:hypothetical protein